ncbi:hypothetical protein XO10_06670 [Marinitoga sp. 1135]|uniref:ABC-type transport system, involved in lipoprotein release, permease component n=1 Tax=Marinitoga piezophila (strain DSM 14283 / JCM 11233 / KA3) TaxID=443254 RepID=H2J3E0_MARPK|nr:MULTISPECIES: FtsX-like permease family protein [Marinitoga]AEX85756.1 ABC-type transport system, involved in lipoprotein release, permease component [Marinitoga piezophila KA3]APT76200.1 hypothetical protein LN42_07225 [Marinitoga sp. 1137]NUU95959.1 hypothetical protein [Marinitoga sp. 1135]NUU97871.1 hypothetical protein [Marinitoga sp. 1138]
MKKHILKISFRNIFRVKKEAFLMILGSMIGMAFIIGSLGINDSFKNYIYKSVELYFGEIDEVLVSKGTMEYSEIKPFLLELEEKNLIDGNIPIVFKLYSVAKKGSIRRLKVSDIYQASVIGMDYNLLKNFGTDKINVPESLLDLKGYNAVLTKKLAQKLKVNVGDEIEIITGSTAANLLFPKIFKVVEIIDSRGVLNYRGLEANNGAGTIFIPLKTIRSFTGIPEGKYHQILISNKGDYIQGNKLTNQVEKIYNEMNIKADFIPVKDNQIRAVDQGGVSYIFLALSLFAIVSGGILIINMYSMLVAERKKELGMLRAIGFKRKEIRLIIFYESLFYTLLSIPFGIFTGIVISEFTFSKVTSLFKSLSNFENIIGEVPLLDAYYISMYSIFIGVIVGVIIPLTITYLYSYSVGRLNIVNAIKDIPENKKEKGIFKYRRIIGNIFALLLFIFALYLKIENFLSLGIKIFSILVASILFITFNLKLIEKFLLNIIKLKGKFVPILKISFSYPMRNSKRTGAIIALYSMVIFIITILTIIPYIHSENLRNSRDALFAGFDGVVVEMPTAIVINKLTKEDLQELPGVKNVGEFYFIRALNNSKQEYALVFGSKEFFLNNKLKIKETIDEFKGLSNEEVWNLVYNNPDYAILPERLIDPKSGYDFELGKEFTGHITSATFGFGKTSSATITYKVIGITSKISESLAMGPILSIKNPYLEKFKKSAVHGFFFSLDNPSYKDSVEQYLKKKNQFYIFVDDIMNLGLKATQGMVDIFNSFLYFGLMVGIIGVSITMMKAVNERKRIIGMLKAIGFTRNMIFMTFFVEATVTIMLGLLIGIFSGTFASYLIYLKLYENTGIAFAVPYSKLLYTTLIFYLISIIAVYSPSKAASKLSPNEAMRAIE